MDLAALRGRLRQEYAEQRNLRPYGRGDVETHTRGYQAEIAAAKYLGADLPEDWTLQGDRSRGCDVAGWNVRSSYKGSRFMWRDHDHTNGNWVFAATEHAPVILLLGWLPGRECPQAAQDGYIPVRALHQLIDWGSCAEAA